MAIPFLNRPGSATSDAALASDDETPWVSHAYSLKGLIPPALLLLSAWLVFPYDAYLAYHCHEVPGGHPKWLRNIFDNVEPFGHLVGVVIASSLVLLLGRNQWKAGLSVFWAGLFGGLAANLGKLLLGRVRPRNFDFATFDSHATITGWMPLLSEGSAGQSFPSAHTATAVALAVFLGSLYPRTRWFFFAMTLLVMGHRVHSGAHYPSDIFTGAALGWLVALVCLRSAIRFRYLNPSGS
jgi:membrane-associated phospholipid phosphatase